ncbi:MAG: 16S rRNA (cytosine(1402)-N(4))-methyltransferase RsmH [Bacteroidales bacterium]|jgi:16S rRNA (cytosine1402-N4)-methyltransferase|nr:16S rRNA (cytosine(1402)-N(4))-methyltransferase RsmH [Bacteroidales bacterium]
MNKAYHLPVLLSTSVDFLVANPSGTYVDVTFGGGGHSREILRRLDANGRLIAFDQDPDSLKNAIEDDRFQFFEHNFCYLTKFLKYCMAYPVDGILADLGVSSYQFDTPERGFSYRFEGALDMRMNYSKGISAVDVVNSYSEERLMSIFYEYGELSEARRIARAITKERINKMILTTTDLTNIVSPLFLPHKTNKLLSQLFQALRIEVNGEIEALKLFLQQTTEALNPGGKLVVISYHSLEDRLVKKFMKSGNFEGVIEKDFYGNPLTPFTVISKKIILPNEEEINSNSRARSAKLRVVEKK